MAERIDDWTIRRTRTAKAIIDTLVGDGIRASQAAIASAGIETPRDACAKEENLIVLSPECDRKLTVLEDFLLERFYHHPSLLDTAKKVNEWLAELFGRLCDKPDLMPGYFQRFIPDHGLHRAVCDYIAGMTDRYCLKVLGPR
jgi:dGTPase